MTRFSDLSWNLVEEILSRVPLTSLGAVRSTCKPWKDLCKDESFTKKHCDKAPKEFLLNMTWNNSKKSLRRHHQNKNKKISMRLDLHNIKDLPSVKEIGKILGTVHIFNVYQCDGLLLCVTNHKSRLVLCNPYMAQTRWIKVNDPIDREHCKYAIGYDNNNNYKVLRYFYDSGYYQHQIYDFKSNSWRVLDITCDFHTGRKGVSLKGYTYFVGMETSGETFVISTERFGPRMYLPCNSGNLRSLPCLSIIPDNMVQNGVREEQLAVLQHDHGDMGYN